MGQVVSFLTRKRAPSSIQSELIVVVQPPKPQSTEVMAAGSPRDVANELSMSTDDMIRYSNGFQTLQEFLNKSGIILDRQRKMQMELETCQERLRKFTGDHARQSESNAENISSTNTPTSLELKYRQFYDHERMDAIDGIEKSRAKKEREKGSSMNAIYDCYVACMIFEESYVAAQALKRHFLQGITLLFTSAPTIGVQYAEEKRKKDGEFHFTIKPEARQQSYKPEQGIENSLKVIMKETAEMCDINELVQKTEGALKKRQEDGNFEGYTKDFFLRPEMRKYTERCCRFVWKLVCQTMPYKVEGNWSLKAPSLFNSAHHQVTREAMPNECTSDLISFVVWPGLFDGHSGRVIQKTEVVLSSI